MVGSPLLGKSSTPPGAYRVTSRMNDPDTHDTPSPAIVSFLTYVNPEVWNTVADASDMPPLCSANVSEESRSEPLPLMPAPVADRLLAHPRPSPPVFPHGHHWCHAMPEPQVEYDGVLTGSSTMSTSSRNTPIVLFPQLSIGMKLKR